VFTGGHLKGTILRDGDATSDQILHLCWIYLLKPHHFESLLV
jgi:hypothetical protein